MINIYYHLLTKCRCLYLLCFKNIHNLLRMHLCATSLVFIIGKKTLNWMQDFIKN